MAPESASLGVKAKCGKTCGTSGGADSRAASLCSSWAVEGLASHPIVLVSSMPPVASRLALVRCSANISDLAFE